MPLNSRPATTELDGSDVDVLVIDDDVAFAQSLVEELQQRGYLAIAAADGADGLRVARDRAPRLILLDLDMPVMSGWQFLDRRRSDRMLSRIPVVVMSAIAGSMAGRPRDDVAAVLEKPLDERQLVSALDLLLRDHPAEGRAASESQRDGRRPLILVVEDDDDTRASVCELLQDNAYRVAWARNGQEAESYLRSSARPDCIVLDLWMPTMDGWTFANRLHQRGERPIPVVVITAAESYWGYPVPLPQVMRKPVHADALMGLLTKVLPPARQTDGAALKRG